MLKKILGVSIGRDAVSAVRAHRNGGGWVLSDYGSAPAVLTDPKALAEGAAAAVRSFGAKGGHVAVSIPDTMAKAAVFEFEELPAKAREAGEIIRLRAGREMNAGPSDRVDFMVLSKGKKVKALAVAIKGSVLAHIEEGLSSAGLYAERISLHSFDIYNLFAPKAPEGDFSILVRGEEYISTAVFRDGALDFYRCKGVNDDNEAVREAGSSFLFYRGRNPEVNLTKAFLFNCAPGLAGDLRGSMDLSAVSPDSLVRLKGPGLEKIPINMLSAIGAIASASS
ncbi:MAG: hypothetical protein HY893_07970 [Deltaproteobacteria bacterium]|nr:hypothetical protein [Deltaproteobacteria bacterium]